MAGIAKKRQQLFTENNSVTGYESKHDWFTSSPPSARSPLLPPHVACLASSSYLLLISAINCAERNVTHAKSSKIKIENRKSKIKFKANGNGNGNVYSRKSTSPFMRLKIAPDNRRKSYGLHIFLCVSEPIRHSSSSNIHKLSKVMAIMPLYGHLIL